MVDEELRELEHRAARLGYVLVKEEDVNHYVLFQNLAARRYESVEPGAAHALLRSELRVMHYYQQDRTNKQLLTKVYTMKEGDTIRPLAPTGSADFRMLFNGHSFLFDSDNLFGARWEAQIHGNIYTNPDLEPLLELAREST